jgi:hypothetical protein
MRWAREHLIYEVKMFAFCAVALYERRDEPRDQESNALIESLGVHTRCLRDFFWGRRRDMLMDAFAFDFCASGAWESGHADVPPVLADIDKRSRIGREIVHLSYHRLGVEPEIKDWPVSEIVNEISFAMDDLAIHALPERMDEPTRNVLREPLEQLPEGVGPESVATETYSGGTIPFEGFSAGS